MPDRPLLLFPTPQPADRTKQKPQFGRVHKPNVTRIRDRLATNGVITGFTKGWES